MTEEEFEKRRNLEYIDNVYIPKNMEECLIELDKKLQQEITYAAGTRTRASA